VQELLEIVSDIKVVLEGKFERSIAGKKTINSVFMKPLE
jgi:hypothetical protein